MERVSESRPSASAERARLWTKVPLINELVSRVTGKALPGQEPLFRSTPLQAAMINVGALALVGPATIALAMRVAEGNIVDLPMLLLGQLLLVGRLRVLQVATAHYAVHRTFCGGSERFNRWIAEIATLIPLAQNPQAYRKDHVGGHHLPRVFTTDKDADAAFLLELGFEPGKSRKYYYRKLGSTLVSPSFHIRFAWARLRSNFIDAGWVRKIAATTWLALLIGGGFATNLEAGLLALGLAMGPLYQASSLLQFLSEHRWMSGKFAPNDIQAYADRSQARFAIARLPAPGLKGLILIKGWLGWIPRQIVELLFRAVVTVGDLPVHDLHHALGALRTRSNDWPQGVFDRQRAIDAGDALALETREACGWREALEWVFDGLAAQPPITAK